MGDVLVYAERRSTTGCWACLAAGRSGGRGLAVLLARGEPDAEEARPRRTRCSRHRTRRLALSPRGTPVESFAAAIRERAPELRRAREHHRRAHLAAAAQPRRLASSATASALALEDGEAQSISGIYGGQLHATACTPLPAVVAVNTTAAHRAAGRRAWRSARGARAPAELEPEDRVCRAGRALDEGVDLTKAERIVCVGRGIGAPRTSRSRRSWPTPSAPSSGRRGR